MTIWKPLNRFSALESSTLSVDFTSGELKARASAAPPSSDLACLRNTAVALLADPAVRARITETAHAFARAGHTYLKRVDDLVRAALPGAEAGGGFAGQ